MKFIDYAIDHPLVIRFLVILLIIGVFFRIFSLASLRTRNLKLKRW